MKKTKPCQSVTAVAGAGFCAAMMAAWAPAANAGAEPYIAEITMFGGNFAPRGWALCDGQILSIAQNTALFSLLGTTYGGNGTTNFALPDLRGRVAVHAGAGPGLSPVSLGERGGSATQTLLVANLPVHNHTLGAGATAALHAQSDAATSSLPTGNVLAVDRDRNYSSTAPNVDMRAGAVTLTGVTDAAGGSQPFSVMPPYLGVNYIIALEGIFPPRN
jgi:microcystin-dependent protein